MTKSERKKKSLYKIFGYRNGKKVFSYYSNSLKSVLNHTGLMDAGESATIFKNTNGVFKSIAKYKNESGRIVRVKRSGFRGKFVRGRKRKKRSDAGRSRIGKKMSDAFRAHGRLMNGANAKSIKYHPKYKKRKEFVHKSRGKSNPLAMKKEKLFSKSSPVYDPYSDPYAY